MEIKSGLKDKSAFAQSKETTFSQMVASASLFSNFIRIGGRGLLRFVQRKELPDITVFVVNPETYFSCERGKFL